MTKQAVLLYNCSGPQWTKLHQMMMMLRFRIRMIRPEQYHLPLEQLAQGQGEPAADNVPETFPESMMVFCGVGQAQLEAILNAIRVLRVQKSRVLPSSSEEAGKSRAVSSACTFSRGTPPGVFVSSA